MSRPTLHELCKINSSELKMLSHEEASLKIINALKEEKVKLEEQRYLIKPDTQEACLCLYKFANLIEIVSEEIDRYTSHYEEMMQPQFEFTSTVSRAGSFIEKCIGRFHE